MKPFLCRVADAYYKQFGAKISRFTFIFPNQRAGVFFQKYLSETAQKPLFSPTIQTISECFQSACDWQLADKLSNLFRLYKIYRQHSGKDEDFDSFVFWGEMLLSDFDEIDRFLVDAKQLFTNISDLKEIDTVFERFTPEQVEIIRQFWTNFLPITEGKSKEDFVSAWRILLPVYEQFRKELIAENLGTEGMIAREVVQRLKTDEIPQWENSQFVFVGFNALNTSEKALFKELVKRGKADFYFDYEAEELQDENNQASKFFKENKELFPSQFPLQPDIISLSDRKMELIVVPSSVGQTKHIYSILDNLYAERENKDDGIKTAIVLPDENLLVPLLHAFPAQIEQINVTMGFPLKATPVFALFEHIFELHRRARTSNSHISFYHQNVIDILNHQYVSEKYANDVAMIEKQILTGNLIYIDAEVLTVNSLFSSVFQSETNTANFIEYLVSIIRKIQNTWTDDDKKALESDFLYQYYITLNRISDILKSNLGGVELTLEALIRLIRQLTQSISIPFEGEPLAGLQVMGVLETRGLDFENIIITSFNEGVFPKRTATNSFIPHSLRKCFGLPVIDLQDAIISYNFYRLISRAKRIFFLSDSRTEGMQTGEVSRFMHQLRYHYGKEVVVRNISYDVAVTDEKVLVVEKSPQVMEKLNKFTTDDFANAFSATSLNSYIDCPLKFYFSQIERISEIDEVKELVQEDMFGTLFHATMENIYSSFVGEFVQPADLKQLSDVENIDTAINLAFSKNFFKRKDGKQVEIEGNNLLIANVIRKYAVQVLKVDKEYAPFKYVASEKRCSVRYPIFEGKQKVNLKGFIDRIDEKEGHVRILDYKTGKGTLEFESIEQIFEHDNPKRPKYALQTFLYNILLENEIPDKNVTPGILYIRDTFKRDFSVYLIHNDKESKKKTEVKSFSAYEDKFRAYLTSCLEEIFNPEIPFVQTTEPELCKYCPYLTICNR